METWFLELRLPGFRLRREMSKERRPVVARYVQYACERPIFFSSSEPARSCFVDGSSKRKNRKRRKNRLRERRGVDSTRTNKFEEKKKKWKRIRTRGLDEI